ncbi:MAG: glycosyltransferase family 4 protein [Bryobacterales bacterium]|nr:glycosyltransferase family 4 protein [Bryobacterales bacterium]
MNLAFGEMQADCRSGSAPCAARSWPAGESCESRAGVVNIVFLLTYYHPHLSGLTIATGNRAEGLSKRGHRVTVISSRHKKELPEEEVVRGVRVIRLPVAWRAGKGVWMRGYTRRVPREAKDADVLVQCLPVSPPEAVGAAIAARRSAKPLILDYACDLRLPGGWKARAIEAAVFQGHLVAGRAARAIVVSTQSYAAASPFLTRFQDRLRVIPLTMRIPNPDPEAVRLFRETHAPGGEKLIGFAGRMAAEKGIDVLLESVRLLGARGRRVRLLLSGDVTGVVGEAAYRQRILGKLDSLGDTCRVLGVIEPDLSAFYGACDVLALPSLNSTESFGMVQAEAMLCGTPVVASRLPGVREPVESTGMGLLAEPGDAAGLADAISSVLDAPERFRAAADVVQDRFSAGRSLDAFEAMLREVLA